MIKKIEQTLAVATIRLVAADVASPDHKRALEKAVSAFNTLTDAELLESLTAGLGSGKDSLDYALSTFNQEFFTNHTLSRGVRHGVAKALVAKFGNLGNAMWGAVADGTFAPIPNNMSFEDDADV